MYRLIISNFKEIEDTGERDSKNRRITKSINRIIFAIDENKNGYHNQIDKKSNVMTSIGFEKLYEVKENGKSKSND
jgi:hypothetical protein